jgi:adenylate kinase family enzyme
MRINEVINRPLEEGVDDPHIFKAIFLAGGPGSGKSYVSGKLTGQKHVRTGLKVVNSDDIFEYMLKKQGLKANAETIFSPRGQEIRTKAKEISKNREDMYLDGRLGLIIDGTGKNVENVRIQKEILEGLGYDTMMLFINTNEDVAIERDRLRPRSIGATEVSKMWKQVQENIMKFQQLFGAKDFHVVDNSGGLEDADRAAQFEKVEMNIDKFLAVPPKRHEARKWIQAAKKDKATNNTLDI